MPFRFTPDHGKYEEAHCCYCGTKCSVERDRSGPRGFAQAMSGGSSEYDLFLCPNNDQDWHVRVEELLEEALGFKSDRLTGIVVCELEDLLSKSLGREDISVYIRSDVQRYDSRAWISKTWAIEIGNMVLSPYDKGRSRK